jgi:hypothetical protein
MRDAIFLVADGSMEQLLRGFFGRPAFHRALGCASFAFDPSRDLIVAPGRDPQVHRLAQELLRPYRGTHARAVVLLDAAWAGSPGPAAIHEHVSRHLRASWTQSAVIVLDPELEAWVWQDNPHVAMALGAPAEFRQILAVSGHWPLGSAKPADPKAALEHLRARHRTDRSKAVFNRLAARISVKGCTDPAFHQLRDTLLDWFPEETRRSSPAPDNPAGMSWHAVASRRPTPGPFAAAGPADLTIGGDEPPRLSPGGQVSPPPRGRRA